MPKRVLIAMCLVVFLGACSDATRPVPPQAKPTPTELICTLIGSIDGVGVHIPVELWVPSGTIIFRVCDKDGCEVAKRRLRPFPKDGPGPDERIAHANFPGFGHRFDAGNVEMTAEIYGPEGALVATRTQEIKLRRSWPNGKACDGEGFLNGGFGMKPKDLVIKPYSGPLQKRS